METSIIPRIYDPTLADEKLALARKPRIDVPEVGAEEGLLVGVSAAAGLVGSLRVAKMPRRARSSVTIFPDSGR